jgi:O-succinylbenzoic acid--CoA ligase
MEVDGWLERAARSRPGLIAGSCPDGQLTYAELELRARAVALELQLRGAARGARVAVALPPGLDFLVTLHACLLLGAVVVPVDPRLSAVERARITGGAELAVREPIEGSRERRLLGPVRHDLDAAAVVIHTSGTTAAPRPVELSYGNLLWSALGSAVALGLDARERWLCALPLSHVGGLSILVRCAIYATTAVVHERFETDRVMHALQAEDVTLVSLVATTLARLLDAGLARPPSLRCALTGGGPIPPALVERALEAGVPVSLTYGMTETGSQVTTTPILEVERGERAPGPPLFCTRLRIAADDEILVSGPTVAVSAQTSGGWLHTGDLGRLDERGRLWLHGRKADTIISGGENVAPVEVEAVLEAHPGVLEAAVVARADPRWGEAVSAIVVARAQAGAELDAEDLRRHCALALAPYKVPKTYELRAQPLPRTASGKLLRRELA